MALILVTHVHSVLEGKSEFKKWYTSMFEVTETESQATTVRCTQVKT